MKRALKIALVVILCFTTLAGCSSKIEESRTTKSAGESLVSNNKPEKTKDPKTTHSDEKNIESSDEIIDLTTLSSTMVYAEVRNMVSNPKDYLGKTIKINGLYYVSKSENAQIYYHAVVVADATSCCAEGLEFIWNGEHAYPTDFPETETKIELVGVWQAYEENGRDYYYIATDKINVL